MDESEQIIQAIGKVLMPGVKTELPLNHTDAILAERGARYGLFTGHALLAQQIKECIQTHIAQTGHITDSTPAYQLLAPDQREALDMIAHKIARILNGDKNYIDNWDDIAGYAKLVADRLREEQNT